MALSDLKSTVTIIENKAAEAISTQNNYTQRINAIDASAPDAAAQLDAIYAERISVAGTQQAELMQLVNTLVAEGKTVSFFERAEGQALVDSATAKIKEAGQAGKAAKDAIAQKSAEIKSLKTTNESATDAAAAEKQKNATIVGDTTTPVNEGMVKTSSAENSNDKQTTELGKRTVAGVPEGAMPAAAQPVQATIKNSRGDDVSKDHRVKIRVPPGYFSQYTSGLNSELKKLGAIIFPYTPAINYDTKAEYVNLNPTHSNFSIYFYKNSSVGSISITGKFTVQNEAEAGIYLATLHLLRALTKMKSGGVTGDVDSGAPPPICRLVAYGDFMMNNVPIVINSFRVDLPDNVDYFRLGKTTGSLANKIYGTASVPLISTIAVTCLPIYSRNEMQKFSVGNSLRGWIGDDASRKAGYL
jgi:hypothetical protein